MHGPKNKKIFIRLIFNSASSGAFLDILHRTWAPDHP